MENLSFYKKISGYYKNSRLAQLQALSYEDLVMVPTLTKTEVRDLSLCHSGVIRNLVKVEKTVLENTRLVTIEMEMKKNLAKTKLTTTEVDALISVLKEGTASGLSSSP